MKKILLPHFGEIHLEYCENEYPDAKDYVHYGYGYSIGATYGDDFKFLNTPLDLDVNFTVLSNENIALVTHSLNNLDKIIMKGNGFFEE